MAGPLKYDINFFPTSDLHNTENHGNLKLDFSKSSAVEIVDRIFENLKEEAVQNNALNHQLAQMQQNEVKTWKLFAMMLRQDEIYFSKEGSAMAKSKDRKDDD
jgi:hypothetical protein